MIGKGNEKADAIAKATTNSNYIGPNTLTHKEADTWSYGEIMEQWNQGYINSETGNHYRIPFQSIYDINNAIGLPRRHQVMLLRPQTGHCKLWSHLHKIGVVDSPLCTQCRTEETVSHFLLFCTKYRSEKNRLIEVVRNCGIAFTSSNLLTGRRALSHAIDYVVESRCSI